MAAFNRVFLMGNLTRDPELRYTSQGTPIVTFSLAVNRKGGNGKDEADYFDIEAWDKTAESCNEYLCKGSLVMVEGRLKQERWEDDGGNKRSRITIMVLNIQFLARCNGTGSE